MYIFSIYTVPICCIYYIVDIISAIVGICFSLLGSDGKTKYGDRDTTFIFLNVIVLFKEFGKKVFYINSFIIKPFACMHEHSMERVYKKFTENHMRLQD